MEAARIWAREAGSGDAVLLIAGLGDDHAVWGETFDLLAARHRVVALDNRGTGRSPMGPEPFTLADMAEDALGVMDAAGISGAHVVGSSMGGAISQELALAAPERVRSLTLIGSWGRPDEHLARLLRHQLRLAESIDDPRALHEAICLWVYSGAAHADGTVDRLVDAQLQRGALFGSEEDLARTTEAAIAHDPGDRLAAIAAPTLVAVGDEDRICPVRLSRHLYEAIPDSRLVRLPGRGHQPFQESPTEIADLLTEFWQTGTDPDRR